MSEKIKSLLEQLREELDKKRSVQILGQTLETTSDEAVETEDLIDFLKKVLDVEVDVDDGHISYRDFNHDIDVNPHGCRLELQISLDTETIIEDVLPEALEREISESSFTLNFGCMSLDLGPYEVEYLSSEILISSNRATLEDFVKNKLEFEVRSGDLVFKPEVTVDEEGKFVLEIEPTSTSDDILKRIPDNVSAKQLLEKLLDSFKEEVGRNG